MATDDPDQKADEQPASAREPKQPNWFAMFGGLFILFTISQALAPHLSHGIGQLLAPDPELAGEGEGESIDEVPPPSDDPPLYLPLDPPLVVNFEDDSVVRFLQVTIEVMARDQAIIDAVQAHRPVIRNNLLLLFGSQNYAQITTREGKEHLRAESLKEIRSIIRRETGVPGVESVYFTTFVVQ